MQFEEYIVTAIKDEFEGVFSLKVKPKHGKKIPPFKPGQFFHIKNPSYKAKQTRQFSIVSTPYETEYLAFCIKIYGKWTQKLQKKKIGDSLFLFGPMGNFTLKEKLYKHVVYIAGGIGITPIVSMLSQLHYNKTHAHVSLIYANATTQTILKKTYLEKLFKENPLWHLSCIVSNPDSQWMGHRGHITSVFLKKELNFEKKQTFFICGSQRFIYNMITILRKLHIPHSHIKQEIFLPQYPT
jgi:ferredoxin-NADP reductase